MDKSQYADFAYMDYIFWFSFLLMYTATASGWWFKLMDFTVSGHDSGFVLKPAKTAVGIGKVNQQVKDILFSFSPPLPLCLSNK